MSVDTTTQQDEPNAVVVASIGDKFPAVKAMVERLNVEATLDQGDTRDALAFQMAIVEGILSGESEEEIFEAQEAGGMSAQDFVNRPFRLAADDLTFVQSTLKNAGSFPFYARMTITEIATGQEYSITCGGFSVVPVLFALREKGFLTQDVAKSMSFKATGTANGNTRLSLVPYTEPKSKARAKN